MGSKICTSKKLPGVADALLLGQGPHFENHCSTVKGHTGSTVSNSYSIIAIKNLWVGTRTLAKVERKR